LRAHIIHRSNCMAHKTSDPLARKIKECFCCGFLYIHKFITLSSIYNYYHRAAPVTVRCSSDARANNSQTESCSPARIDS
jgi:hypothetical protein